MNPVMEPMMEPMMESMMEPECLLAKRIRQFLILTLAGQDSGMWRAAYTRAMFDPEKLSTPEMNVLLLDATRNYFNRVYNSTVTGDDPYVNEKMSWMRGVMKHSPVCLINILAKIAFDFYRFVDRSSFTSNHYGEYMDNVRFQIDMYMDADFVDALSQSLSHNCTGPENSPPLSPGQEMFYLK